jgi:protein-tyrosine-phosphatase/predicted ATP-grasp superfamily ATP-dependent carboligase
MARIAILGSSDRAGLAVCRSLGMAGHHVEILRSSARKSAADYSRFSKASTFVGNANLDLQAVTDRLLAEGARFDYLLPASDGFMEVVYHSFEAFSRVTKVIGPSHESYALAHNKLASLELLARMGVKAPEFKLVESIDCVPPVEFPCFAKPLFSAKVIGGRLHGSSVAKILDPKALIRKLRDDLAIPIMLQQPVEGTGVGINFAAHEGRLLGISVTERIHEPGFGGGSSYRKTGHITPSLVRLATDLAAHLSWSGFMMIECKRRNDELYFMELNGRPWGSIPLSIFAGVDYPKLVLDAYEGKAPATCVLPTREVYARHLKKDLGWALKHWRSLPGWLASLGRIVMGRESFDVERLTDPLPGLYQFPEMVLDIADKLKTRLPPYQPESPRPTPHDRVLVVCKGNINRSVVLEAALRKRGFDVSSASILPRRGRRPSEHAESYIRSSLGIDFSSHRSRVLEDVYQAGMKVIVFEGRQVNEVSQRLPLAKGSIFMLTRAAGEDGDVCDPDGLSEQEYRSCFMRIEALAGKIANV